MSGSSSKFYPRFGKRLLDLALTLPMTILSSPLMIMTASLVRVIHGKPVLFRHIRPGWRGKPFVLLKFRTMSEARDSQGNLLPDEMRLTRLGKFLRGTSLDELPGLLNIMNGDMSLVGPRPLLMEYLDRYTSFQARRHEVRPGLTGWAQVNGRNAITWEEKFALDVWYVDHHSLWLDLKIIGLTIVKVLRREGISAEGETTMPVFLGTDKPGTGENG